MALVINTNINSLYAQRQLNSNSGALSTSLQRLSSGIRINSAKDDAAGLAITNRFTSQVRGLNQAARNANDAISYLQVAEGAFAEATNLIQRMRELAIQAANEGALSVQDKINIQKEVTQLVAEVDRIGETTSYGQQKLFAATTGSIADTDQQPIIEGLKSYWLREAQERVSTYYGLDVASGGPDLTIEFTTAHPALAFVQSTTSGGNLISQKLVIDIDDFTPANLPNGGTAPIYNDRIIAHEMVHAIMYRTMDASSARADTIKGAGSVGSWFLEGAAEFIHGGHERVAGALSGLTDGGGAAGVFDEFVDLLATDSVNGVYAAGYAAVAFMHADIIDNNGGAGLRDVMADLAAGDDLDTAIASNTSYASIAAFETAFTGATGEAFVAALDLANADTGAIGGLDVDGGAELTQETVFANIAAYEDNPLSNINVIFPETVNQIRSVETEYQVGAQSNEIISASVGGLNASILGISSIDVTTNAGAAISYLDEALTYISSTRADLGAVQNRLESTLNNLQSTSENVASSRSRVLDADYAVETGRLIKSQIIQQAAFSVLSQANSQPQIVLELLG